MFYVFYAGLLYGEYEYPVKPWLHDLPNGAYIYATDHKDWFHSDGTRAALEDVPKELRLQILLLT